MINSCLTKEESERIGLLSQLNIEKVPVSWLNSMLIRLRDLKARKFLDKNGNSIDNK